METVSTYENDVLKSQTVNGVPQAVTNQGNDFTVTGREKTGKDVDATAGKETVAGQGAHGGEGGAEEMEKYKNVQTIEEDASAGNETVEGVGGGEGAVEGEKSGDSSSALANGGTFHLPHLTHSWISFSNSTVISLFVCDNFTQTRSQSECWLKLLLYAVQCNAIC